MFDKLSIRIYNETLLSLMFDKLSISIYNETLLSLLFDKLMSISI